MGTATPKDRRRQVENLHVIYENDRKETKQNKDRHTHRSTVHRYGAAAENTVGRRKLFPDIQGKARLQIPVAGW